MTLAIAFWILMLLWLVLGIYQSWPASGATAGGYWPIGGNLLLFLLIFILGVHSFGWPIKGS